MTGWCCLVLAACLAGGASAQTDSQREQLKTAVAEASRLVGELQQLLHDTPLCATTRPSEDPKEPWIARVPVCAGARGNAAGLNQAFLVPVETYKDLQARLEQLEKSLRAVRYDLEASGQPGEKAPPGPAAKAGGKAAAPAPPSRSESRSAPRAAEPQRCAAITRAGARCTRMAEAGGRFCWQHRGK